MRDPFAMRPFFGYNAGHYLQHWLNMERHTNYQLPKIFHVNWFRRDSKGGFLWPGELSGYWISLMYIMYIRILMI